MNMPNFKDILQKLSVFKNNLSLLVPVIIALVAVLLFIPTQLMSSKLKKDVEQESINKGGNRIMRLEKSVVSRQQYEMEAERQKAHAADANEIAKLVKQGSQRELLSYDIFPAPDPNGFSGLIFQQYGQNYRSGIDKLILSVNGGDCPTDAEIQRGLEGSSSRSRMRGRGASMMSPSMSPSRTSSSRGYSGMGLYGGGSMGISNIERMILDEMCNDRARSVSAYVNPVDISGYEYWADYTYEDMNDAVEDCFYHQLAYWIIEDIFQTIGTMNSDHENVLVAPAKRFMGITFTMGLKRPGSGGGGAFRGRGRGSRGRTAQKKSEDADRPAYVRPGAPGLSETCTGRYCTEKDFDVTHFNFSVIVSTKSVLPFMKELCSAKEHQFRGYPDPNQPVQTFQHNQITILESKIGSINPDDFTHRYYRYGDESVVSLDLICEYIFNIASYEILVPQPVLDTLAGKDEDKKK